MPNNTQLAIVTVAYDVTKPGLFKYQAKRLMHYKAAAAYSVKIILNRKNIRFNTDGNPEWKKHYEFECLRIYDNTMTEIAHFGWNNYGWDDSKYIEDIEWVPEMYSATMYILRAMDNARSEVKLYANSEMTPSEIENELNLSSGVVRKYIHDHRDSLLDRKMIRAADGRTVLCKRGWAINRWGQK